MERYWCPRCEQWIGGESGAISGSKLCPDCTDPGREKKVKEELDEFFGKEDKKYQKQSDHRKGQEGRNRPKKFNEE